MAPEVVLTQGHDRSSDYWAFGVLLYVRYLLLF